MHKIIKNDKNMVTIIFYPFYKYIFDYNYYTIYLYLYIDNLNDSFCSNNNL
jgi:hypothetical protein